MLVVRVGSGYQYEEKMTMKSVLQYPILPNIIHSTPLDSSIA
jgi:hypothetical protein